MRGKIQASVMIGLSYIGRVGEDTRCRGLLILRHVNRGIEMNAIAQSVNTKIFDFMPVPPSGICDITIWLALWLPAFLGPGGPGAKMVGNAYQWPIFWIVASDD